VKKAAYNNNVATKPLVNTVATLVEMGSNYKLVKSCNKLTFTLLTSSLRFLRLRTVFSLISQRTEKRAGFILWQFSVCFRA